MKKFTTFTFVVLGAVVVALVFGFWLLSQQPKIILERDRINKSEIILERDRTTESLDRTTKVKTPEQEILQAILEVPNLSYQVFVPEGSTAYDLMVVAASQYNNFAFKGREFSGLGFFVEEINGLSHDKDNGMYWIYYINGKKAPVGISQYKLKNNDVITWKYEKAY